MRNTNLRSGFSKAPDEMLLVLKPERGYFTFETIKRWACETLFYEDGIVTLSMSIEEAILVLHKYDLVEIRL